MTDDDVVSARPGGKGLAPLLALAERSPDGSVIVDLSLIETLDSRSLMSLVRCDKTLRAAGGGMVLAALRPDVDRVLECTGLATRLEIALTSREARARLRQRAGAKA